MVHVKFVISVCAIKYPFIPNFGCNSLTCEVSLSTVRVVLDQTISIPSKLTIFDAILIAFSIVADVSIIVWLSFSPCSYILSESFFVLLVGKKNIPVAK